ncbi:hypothetical protein [Salimicrobium humidisoli]|nr:hypothetical protein [Salimicrobium humidisoli]
MYALLHNRDPSVFIEKEKRLLTEDEENDINVQVFKDMEVENE